MASDAKVSFPSKVEYRAVIRYLYLKGKTGQEIHCELTNVYGSSAPFWVGEFICSRTSLEDETRSGCPSDATDEEMCNKVRIWCTLIGEFNKGGRNSECITHFTW